MKIESKPLKEDDLLEVYGGELLNYEGLFKAMDEKRAEFAKLTSKYSDGKTPSAEDLLLMQQKASEISNLDSLTSNIMKIQSEMQKVILSKLR